MRNSAMALLLAPVLATHIRGSDTPDEPPMMPSVFCHVTFIPGTCAGERQCVCVCVCVCVCTGQVSVLYACNVCAAIGMLCLQDETFFA